MEVFRRNAQPHITDMRKGGAWGFVPNKQKWQSGDTLHCLPLTYTAFSRRFLGSDFVIRVILLCAYHDLRLFHRSADSPT